MVGGAAVVGGKRKGCQKFIKMKKLVCCLTIFVVRSWFGICVAEDSAGIPLLFETPIAAADAFVDALKTGETAPLIEIFGSKHRDMIGTIDEARDRELRARVFSMALERRRFRFNDDGSVSVVVGFEAWAFPIPLAKVEEGWRFDTDAGIDELVKRRIGENELTAIAAMHSYVSAQRQYAAAPKDGTQVRQFARRFESTPGKRDGLYWPDKGDQEQASPWKDIKDTKTPYAGYHFKILTAQGPSAPAGKYNYMINGRLLAGFALVAWPAAYGKTGVMTLLVNHYGEVHQKNLGEDTAKRAAAILEYNPDKSWTKVTD